MIDPMKEHYSGKILNSALVLGSCGGDSGMAQIMVKRFLIILPTERAELEQAYHAGDLDTVRQRAHRLRSGSLYVGAERFSAAAEVLEEGISADAPQETIALAWANLCQEFQVLLEQPEETLLAAL